MACQEVSVQSGERPIVSGPSQTTGHQERVVNMHKPAKRSWLHHQKKDQKRYRWRALARQLLRGEITVPQMERLAGPSAQNVLRTAAYVSQHESVPPPAVVMQAMIVALEPALAGTTLPKPTVAPPRARSAAAAPAPAPAAKAAAPSVAPARPRRPAAPRPARPAPAQSSAEAPAAPAAPARRAAPRRPRPAATRPAPAKPADQAERPAPPRPRRRPASAGQA